MKPKSKRYLSFVLVLLTLLSSLSLAEVSFEDATTRLSGPWCVGIAIGDLNGDGTQDIASATNWYGDYVSFSDGNGGFFPSPWLSLDTGSNYRSHMSLVDYDADGDFDICWGYGGLENDGTGQFTPTTALELMGNNDSNFADLDGDGYCDSVTARNGAGGVCIWHNDKAGNFELVQQFATMCGDGGIEFGDIDGDGDLDLSAGNSFYMNDGNGWFTNAGDIPHGENESYGFGRKLCDLNNDGNLDIIAWEHIGEYHIFFGDGHFGGFHKTEQTIPGYLALDVGDVDNDGDIDIVTADARLYLNDGTGYFGQAVWEAPRSGYSPSPDVAFGDFNNDGCLDIVMSDYFPPSSSGVGSTRVFFQVKTSDASIVIETVTVGNAGNEADTTGYGSVSYAYKIGKYEITAGQYTEFLNAVAKTDTYGLYNTLMWLDIGQVSNGCKIQRLGASGSYTYSVAADYANRPVNYVSWGDAARFANWLHNNQPKGLQDLTTTEDGAYYLNGAISDAALLAVSREPDWKWAIPTEDEWYKAAYHKKYYGLRGYYFNYPASSDIMPSNNMIEPDPGNNATFMDAPGSYTIGGPYFRTEIGAHEKSSSPYGTYDQGGNVWEWIEPLDEGMYSGAKGGSFFNDGNLLHRSSPPIPDTHIHEWSDIGFRVAEFSEESVPPPAYGDANHDGHVNLDDFIILKQNYGASVDSVWEMGDFNGDGDVDLDDFIILKQNYGSQYFTGEQIELNCGDCVTMTLVKIPAGSFMMGSPEDELDRYSDEGPLRRVTLTQPFYMGIYEVTQAQYQAVMGANPSYFESSGLNAPVEQVSWNDAVAFCSALSQRTGAVVSLPTEAQWEYACRAGSQTRFYYGDDLNYSLLGNYAWYGYSSGGSSGYETHPVGEKIPNAWGLYDMHGNVWEWCQDWYGSYVNAGAIDPQGPQSGSSRVVRGGSWGYCPRNCRSAIRYGSGLDNRDLSIGFRVVLFRLPLD